jgi:hypothetical protein
VNSENLKHGIGTLLFDNDFSYQGMFENDKMTGIGISEDAYMVKYIGEHKDGKRDGRGILQMPDGREYEGTWRENRMHGRGQERMPNGQSFMVFTDNGKTLEIVTMGKDAKQDGQASPAKKIQQSMSHSLIQDRERMYRNTTKAKRSQDNQGNSSGGSSQGKFFVAGPSSDLGSGNSYGANGPS